MNFDQDRRLKVLRSLWFLGLFKDHFFNKFLCRYDPRSAITRSFVLRSITLFVMKFRKWSSAWREVPDTFRLNPSILIFLDFNNLVLRADFAAPNLPSSTHMHAHIHTHLGVSVHLPWFENHWKHCLFFIIFSVRKLQFLKFLSVFRKLYFGNSSCFL